MFTIVEDVYIIIIEPSLVPYIEPSKITELYVR